jgi:hypothetical protein
MASELAPGAGGVNFAVKRMVDFDFGRAFGAAGVAAFISSTSYQTKMLPEIRAWFLAPD